MNNKSIFLIPVDPKEPRELNCPACNSPIYLVQAEQEDVIRGGPWLRDGDTIPFISEELTVEQKEGIGYDYELLVGSQSCCGKDYYVLECFMIHAAITDKADDAAVMYYFQDHGYQDGRCYVAHYTGDDERIPKEWITTAVASPKGIIYRHTFGPFLLVDKIIGAHGVSNGGKLRSDSVWRLSADILLTLWDDLKVIDVEAIPTIVA